MRIKKNSIETSNSYDKIKNYTHSKQTFNKLIASVISYRSDYSLIDILTQFLFFYSKTARFAEK